jgi:deazaflavin-dependent oxidoreductase (nitroreductase family)
VPKLPKVAAAVAGAAVAAAMAFPPSRRQSVRVVRAILDELAMRAEADWSQRLMLLTTEGHRTGFPQTVVLSGVEVDGETYVVPWLGTPAWLRNVRATAEVVVDDRVSVHRARAEVVEGPPADQARRAVLASLPGPVRAAIETSGVALRKGSPAVRFQPR